MDKIIATIIGGIAIFIGFVILVLVIGLLVSFPVMWLWNGCLVGLVAGITPITSVWQSWGLLILCAFLFKSSRTGK